jgi:hypothetical protein
MSEAATLIPGPRYEEGVIPVIDAVLYDVDNTLVSHAGPELPSEHFRDAVVKGTRLGYGIGLASARPMSKVRHILSYMGATGYSILCNGAQIVDSETLHVEEEWPIDRDVCRELIVALGKMGVGYWINDDGVDHFPVDGSPLEFERQADIWNLASPRIPVHDYEPDKPFVMNLHMVTGAQAEDVAELVSEMGNPDVTTLISHTYPQDDGSALYDQFVVHRLGNKEHALRRVAELSGIPLERHAAVGDGSNDEVMLRAVGLGIAMGNAAPETLAVARMIAPNREDDGAAVAQEYLNSLKRG